MAGGGEGQLTAVLEEVWATSLPLAERRRLMARATAAPLLQPVRPDGEGMGGGGGTVVLLEEVLSEAAAAAGRDRVNVAQAKAMLRARGAPGRRLASRLGKLTTGRNVAAHPDVSLPGLVAGMLGGSGSSSSSNSSCSTGAADEGDVGAADAAAGPVCFFVGEAMRDVGVQAAEGEGSELLHGRLAELAAGIAALHARVAVLEAQGVREVQFGEPVVQVSVDVGVQVGGPLPGGCVWVPCPAVRLAEARAALEGLGLRAAGEECFMGAEVLAAAAGVEVTEAVVETAVDAEAEVVEVATEEGLDLGFEEEDVKDLELDFKDLGLGFEGDMVKLEMQAGGMVPVVEPAAAAEAEATETVGEEGLGLGFEAEVFVVETAAAAEADAAEAVTEEGLDLGFEEEDLKDLGLADVEGLVAEAAAASVAVATEAVDVEGLGLDDKSLGLGVVGEDEDVLKLDLMKAGGVFPVVEPAAAAEAVNVCTGTNARWWAALNATNGDAVSAELRALVAPHLQAGVLLTQRLCSGESEGGGLAMEVEALDSEMDLFITVFSEKLGVVAAAALAAAMAELRALSRAWPPPGVDAGGKKRRRRQRQGRAR